MSEQHVDLLIVGGGINGTGIARDAAGRGLSVILVEKDDLASHTSSASSKLIHGGLRYLEQFDFKLVRESLSERERLLRAAPHIVEPLQFVIPVTSSSRAPWKLRAGLFLYDHLGARRILPGSRAVRLDGEFGEGLRPGAREGFAYWDCRVQDSRLVVLNALDAAERGASVLTRTELMEATREKGYWAATTRGPAGERTIRARAIVNAAGPWAGQMFGHLAGVTPPPRVRLVKGSHIVLPRLHRGDHAFLLQNPDGRIVFAIPFEDRFTLVGTTDVEWTGEPNSPRISDEEADYLLTTVARCFPSKISRADVVWSYAGIRTLYDDGASDPSKITRDYLLDVDAAEAPLLSVFGGKITTYRLLAEHALDRLARFFPAASGAWTNEALLPGGDIPDHDLQSYSVRLCGEYEQVPPDLLARLVRTYGTRTERLLDGVRSVADLGEYFGSGLYAREVEYLIASEWARSAEDVLFRRTKHGLHLPQESIDRLAAFIAAAE